MNPNHNLTLNPNPVGRGVPTAPLPSPLRGEGQGEVSSSLSSVNTPENSALRAPNSALVRAQLSVETSVESTDPDVLHIRASDETLDRYKEVIVASGWRLDNYLRNPVIQNAHQYGDIIFTIGRAEKTWVSGNALLQTWRFASNENPFAKIARDLYRGKFLQAASVGFVPLRWEDGTEKSAFIRRYTEQELLEVSAVGIPANPNALTLALKAGAVQESDVRELYDLLSHLVGPSGFGVPPLGGLPSPLSGRGKGEGAPENSALRNPRFAFELRRLAHELRQLKELF